jgi:hypothetical protein
MNRVVWVLKAIALWLSLAVCVQWAPAGNLPLPPGEARTPDTRALTPAEAAQALERDWLFQAMGEPLLDRATKEIAWARSLAGRLARGQTSADLSAELRELDALEKRLPEMRAQPAAVQPVERAEPMPSWIWYPEGKPAEDAPAEARFFRCRFDVPKKVGAAELRIAADDACEVFLNGTRVGTSETWQRAVVFDVGRLLHPGANLLAVRAVNGPAPSKNPAGLIARLAVTLADGKRVLVVSSGSWRAEKEKRAQWEQATFDDSLWKPALVAAPFGGGPWGKIAGLAGPDVHEDPVAAYAHVPPTVRDFYFAVRRVKRAILLKNPVLDFSRLLLIDQPLPQGPESRHEAIHRMGIMAVPGGRLLVLDALHPGASPRQLAPLKPGSFWRPDLSFDARKVLFCFKPHDEKSFHLYEINLDGTGLKQLTDGDYDDLDPLYLPDGHVLFTTTRGNSYVRCGPFIYSTILARCDADGGNVYLISYNGEPDFVPALLNDGRVVYSRWEYTDKPLWRLQKLWTTNQDGTGTAHFWGNQSVWPDHLSEPRPIPGSRRVMFSGVGHHDWWSGSIGIVDPDLGRDYPHGLTKVTADLPWPEVGDGPSERPEAADYHASGRFTGYKTAYPLSEEDFLVSARGIGDKFRLYLMDVHGNRDLIYEGVYNVWHAMPLTPRLVPPVHADRVVWPGTGKDRRPVEPGAFFSADVCQGVPDLPREKVKYLRVFQLDYKTYSTWNKTYRHSGPSVSIVQEEGVKRILSEVPVEADGSVHFKAPAGVSLYFQLLDADRRCVQTMRSFTGLMPGEQRGCVGCHELHSTAPPQEKGTGPICRDGPKGASHKLDLSPFPPGRGLALLRPPSGLAPPPWGTESISFERFAQPVLDRYCVSCHRPGAPQSAEPDLSLRPGHDLFKEPYLTLVGPAGWGNPIAAGRPGYGIAGAIPVESAFGPGDSRGLTTLRPMQYLSCKSRLVELSAGGKHYDVKVDSISLRRLMAWVDACCPYRGEEEVRALGDPDFPGIEFLPIRPRVATAPVIDRP